MMEAMEISPAVKKNNKILIVDDDKDFALSIMDILESRNYEVEIANSAKDAYEKLSTFNAAVSLIDVRLGMTCGIDLISTFKKINPEILCVMMTGYVAVDTAIKAIHEGAYDYLRKPLDGRELLAAVSRCFEKINLREEKQIAERILKERNCDLKIINERLKMIVESARSLVACSSIPEICICLLDEFSTIMNVEGGSIYLADENGLNLVHALDPGHALEKINFPLPVGSILEKMLKDGKPLLLHDIDNQEDLLKSGWCGYKDCTLLIFPILGIKSEIIGIISLHNKRESPFAIQDKEIGLILISYGYEAIRIVKSAENLKQSEKRFRELVGNLPVGIYQSAAGTEGRIITANPSIVRMFGFDSVEEFCGCRMSDFFLAPSDYTEFMNKLIATDYVSAQLFPMKKKNGGLIWGSVTARAVRDDDGNIINIDGMLENYTKRKIAEETLIQSEKMLSIGLLTAGFAHEINNPLAGVLQNLQVLRNRMHNNLPKNSKIAAECGTTINSIESYIEKRDMFKIIDSIMLSGRRAKKIVDDLLSFSRKSKPHLAPGNIVELLDKSVDLVSNDFNLRNKYDFRNIEIVREYEKKLPPVMCEKIKIQQVFLNILKNGAQAMMDREIAERKPQFIFKARHDKNMVCIEIKDNGPGMTESVRKRIFEPFFTTKKEGYGTGLGLSVSCFIITEDHHGTLTVESTPGKGASFFINIPIVQK
jgi:PAS domain S-box-containing protein